MATRTVPGQSLTVSENPRSLIWALISAVNRHLQYAALGNPGFAILTNFDVQNANALSYRNAGELKTLASGGTFDTGTTKVIAIDRWGIALLSASAAGTKTLTWVASDFATEAAAIAEFNRQMLLASGGLIPSGHTPLGYVTVLTGSGMTWTAGTDALQGGTGGTPSLDTNYYNGIVDEVISIRELGQPGASGIP